MSLADVAWRPPPLETDRLLLRGYEPSDLDAIFAYASDAEVTPFMAWDRHVSIVQTRAFVDGWVVEKYRARELDYCVCLRNDPETAIGGVGLYWQNRAHGVMELGYVLRPSSWGQGLVPEAGRRLIRHAFETSAVERIYAPIFADNAKSRRAAEKMGLAFEGVLRSAVAYRGRRWDQAIYSIVRRDAR